MTLLALVVFLPVALYIPIVQDWVCQAAVSALNQTSDDVEYEVGSVRIGFPFKLRVNDVSMKSRSDGHVLFHVGCAQTSLVDVPTNTRKFVFGELLLSDVVAGFDSLSSSIGLYGKLEQLEAKRIEIDMESQYIYLHQILLSEPDLKVYVGPSTPDGTDESQSWSVSVDQAVLREGKVGVEMSDVSLGEAMNSTLRPEYLDYHHLLLSGINAEVEHIVYDEDLISATVNYLQAHEDYCGLELTRLTTEFQMCGSLVKVNDLDLGLAQDDYLYGDFSMDLRVLDEIPRGALVMKLEAAIDSANLIRLATPYVPKLDSTWSVAGQSVVNIDGRLTSDTFDIRTLRVEIPRHLSLSAEGFGTQWRCDSLRKAAVTLRGELQHTEPLLSAFVSSPSGRDYRLPDSLHLDLEAAQRNSRVSASVDLLHADRHVAKVDARYDTETEAYHVNAVTNALDVSDFVPSVVADGVTMRLQADGRHFDLKHPSTRVEAQLQIDTVFYLSDVGRLDSLMGISATASLIAGRYCAEIASSHPTLKLDAHVEGNYLRDTVSAQGHLDVLRAELSHLPYFSLNSDLGRLGFCSDFELGYDWGENAQIRLDIDTLSYEEGELHQHFDEINLHMSSNPQNLNADLRGGDASLTLHADRSVVQLPAIADSLLLVLNSQLKSYRPDVALLFDQLPKLDLSLRMGRQNPFSQALERQEGITFDYIKLDAAHDQDLTLSGYVLNYLDAGSGTSFDTIALALQPSHLARSYDYQLQAQHHDIRQKEAYNIHASGSLMPDSLTVGMTYHNGNHKILYDVMASLALADDTMTLHLEKGPTLYEQPFTVNSDNYVCLMNYRDVDNVKPTTRARLMLEGPRDLKLQLYSRKIPNLEVGNQMLLRVRNLDLDYARSLMAWDYDASGRVEMTTAVDFFPDSIHARLRTGIKNFAMGGCSADTLALDVTALAAPGRRDVNGTIALDSIVKVMVDATLSDSTNIMAHVDRLPLPLVNAFLSQNMILSGTASGHFEMHGKDIEHAKISGGIALNDAQMTYTDLDARLTLPTDTLRFGHNRLLVHDYKVLAANKNPINIRGVVDMSKNISDPAVSLTVSGENVLLIDNKKLVHKTQYVTGKLPVTPNIKVEGTLSKLKVDGRLSLLSGTNLKYYMQDDPLESSSQIDKMVEFVRFDQIDRMSKNKRAARRHNSRPSAAHDELNLDLKIDIANDAKVLALLAGADNNSVEIVGGGSLNLHCGTDGNLLMNGTYGVNNGKVEYKLPILPLIKTFKISNTSDMTWQDCDPGNPIINITATEDVKTTVNDDAGSRVVRFVVSINIKGTLDALQLTFDCSAPEDGAISSDIATLDADERSKAALMLLIAQTYIGPGNSSSMGLGTANAALNSMLNREMESMLSGMKGTNIDLGIDTYNTDGGNTRTDYSVKVSQNFFDDRFRATIGGQMSSGGDAGQSRGARLGDLSLEWLIKKDGSHLMKLFRKTNYESVLEGELIETGISYVQERSAYRLQHLFIPTSQRRQQRIQSIVREMQEQEERTESEVESENDENQQETK